jgi:hypothetical protein
MLPADMDEELPEPAPKRTSADGGEDARARQAAVALDESLTRSERIAVNLTVEYMLRSLRSLRDCFEGDIMLGVVVMAIAAANSAHLSSDGALPSDQILPGGVVPDELRRPVSVLGVAGALGLPYETVRRYVNRLIAAGRCVKVRNGVIVPAAVFNEVNVVRASRESLGNIRRLYRALENSKFDFS